MLPLEPPMPEVDAGNRARLVRARHIVALASGTVAGICQLGPLSACAAYGFLSLVCTLILFVLCRNSSALFESPRRAISTFGVVEAAPGFILAWVLIYGLIET